MERDFLTHEHFKLLLQILVFISPPTFDYEISQTHRTLSSLASTLHISYRDPNGNYLHCYLICPSKFTEHIIFLILFNTDVGEHTNQ